MASMGPAAFKRLVRAGHLVRFGQKDNIDRLLEQLFSVFGFFQRLVRRQSCNPEDEGDCDRSCAPWHHALTVSFLFHLGPPTDLSAAFPVSVISYRISCRFVDERLM